MSIENIAGHWGVNGTLSVLKIVEISGTMIEFMNSESS